MESGTGASPKGRTAKAALWEARPQSGARRRLLLVAGAAGRATGGGLGIAGAAGRTAGGGFLRLIPGAAGGAAGRGGVLGLVAPGKQILQSHDEIPP